MLEDQVSTYEANTSFQTFVLVYTSCVFVLMFCLFLVARLFTESDEQHEVKIPVVVKPFITIFLERKHGIYKNRYAEYYTVNNNLKGPYFDEIKKTLDQKLY